LEIQDTVACVRTARGTAAIGSIELYGPDALSIVQQIFRPAGENAAFDEGQIIYGRFHDAGQVIDDGLVGVEEPDHLALHCHGNPLILQQLLKLLQKHGAEIIILDPMLARRYAAESANTIEAEAKLESLKAVSLLGVHIILNQTSSGLLKTVQQWLDSADILTIQKETQEILQRSRIAERIMRGVRIIIAGPPNSGKSTLLNQLAGQEQALVSEIAGTTRDWVTTYGRIQPLSIEWIDTAGLDEQLADIDSLEQTAQQRTKDLLVRCDLILYVLDGTRSASQKTFSPPVDVPVLTVLNKSDLPGFQPRQDTIPISAKTGDSLEGLARKILRALEITDFDPQKAVVFTERQKQLLRQIETCSNQKITDLIHQLLNS